MTSNQERHCCEAEAWFSRERRRYYIMLSISEEEVEGQKDGSVAKVLAWQMWGAGFEFPEHKVGVMIHACDLNPLTGGGDKNPQKQGPARLACAVENRRPYLKTKSNAQSCPLTTPPPHTHTKEAELAAKTPLHPNILQIIKHDSLALSKHEKVIARQNSCKAIIK